ncbi:VapB-type antitoxin [Acidianus brierleyi]|jgi:bifunctional DNA-binding transcriptional regulator/antitoxin component of YhaV-PrlF toxin-antitoxin module|uniref:VapB-type antitoxin n=1 Tax=Acidianus brierleyi TaxID=41673 RepID=A0A2U9IDC2_9CREN|nr:VapB-type antitoxin [Acidianus brierleyi]AWR94015.1 VapB-type antitoxin [Acidianus brierleyi]
MGYVVKVDNKGRIKLPKGLDEASSVIIIDAGTFFVGIPVPKDPLAKTSGIIKTDLSVRELKELAEKEAEKDALERYQRRQHADRK